MSSSSNNNTNTLSDFYNPVYLQGYEYINYFAEFQNNGNNWIKLVYFIDRSRFKSSLGTNKVLRNHVAYNGEPIFNVGDKIDFNKFKLKEETVEASIVTGYLATRKSALENDKMIAWYEEFPQYKVALDQLEISSGRPNNPGYVEFQVELTNAMAEMMVNDADVDTTLAELEAKGNELLNE